KLNRTCLDGQRLLAGRPQGRKTPKLKCSTEPPPGQIRFPAPVSRSDRISRQSPFQGGHCQSAETRPVTAKRTIFLFPSPFHFIDLRVLYSPLVVHLQNRVLPSNHCR